MNNYLERILKEAVVAWQRYYIDIYVKWLRKTWLRIAGVPAKIPAERRTNTSRERYLCSNRDMW
jgi:hypothetical protein